MGRTGLEGWMEKQKKQVGLGSQVSFGVGFLQETISEVLN